ncbi:Cyclin-dependent kinase 11 [Araneus ventricosus]|uniref:Cyclin-dependent kinase 11 n=1 Tax=Araneus ventricosus TaxID=182803 RepID=A0A4Y2NKT1_ARAVE|nr:Cyclin-dependent kinase 11 [Araneus ventricosus]
MTYLPIMGMTYLRITTKYPGKTESSTGDLPDKQVTLHRADHPTPPCLRNQIYQDFRRKPIICIPYSTELNQKSGFQPVAFGIVLDFTKINSVAKSFSYTMDKIPGLDILNASGDGHQPPSIFDETFQMPLNMGSMRTEGDFQYTFMHKIKAQIHLGRGKDLQNKKEITLVIYNETQDPDDELTDILQELEIISDLDQNNILKFYETIAGNTLTDVAFVFEPHASLMSEIIGQKIEKLYEPPVIKTLMRELFTALGYLHKNGIIHGDIQPENIVFTSAGVLKVWNFRNARRVNQKPKKVKVNEFRSANCIFVQLWLKKSIFPEHGREKVLEGIFKLLGFPKKDIWEEFYSFPGVNDLLVFSRIARYNMVDRYFMKYCDRAVSPNTMDLIHRCFRYNRKHRPKAEYCLLHPYFIEEPGACPVEEILTLLDHSTICGQLRAMKDKKSV